MTSGPDTFVKDEVIMPFGNVSSLHYVRHIPTFLVWLNVQYSFAEDWFL